MLTERGWQLQTGLQSAVGIGNGNKLTQTVKTSIFSHGRLGKTLKRDENTV